MATPDEQRLGISITLLVSAYLTGLLIETRHSKAAPWKPTVFTLGFLVLQLVDTHPAVEIRIGGEPPTPESPLPKVWHDNGC